MKVNEFIKKIEESLLMDREGLTLEIKLDDLEEWDSVGRLGIIALFNDEFNKKISAKELKACETIRDIVNLAKGELED